MGSQAVLESEASLLHTPEGAVSRPRNTSTTFTTLEGRHVKHPQAKAAFE